QKRYRLTGKCPETQRGADWPLNAIRERVAERGGGGHVIVIRGHNLGRLAESFLGENRIGRIRAAYAQRRDDDGRDEHAESAPHNGFAVEQVRSPGEAETWAEQVRRSLVNGRVALARVS